MKRLIALLLILTLSLTMISACSEKKEPAHNTINPEQTTDETEDATEPNRQEIDPMTIAGTYDEISFRLDDPYVLISGAKRANFDAPENSVTISPNEIGYLMEIEDDSTLDIFEHFFHNNYLIFREELITKSIEGTLSSSDTKNYELTTDPDGYSYSCKISIPINELSKKDIQNGFAVNYDISDCSLRLNAENNSFSYSCTFDYNGARPYVAYYDFRGTYTSADSMITLDLTSCYVYDAPPAEGGSAKKCSWKSGAVTSVLYLDNDELYNTIYKKSEITKKYKSFVSVYADTYGDILYDLTGSFNDDFAHADYPIFYLGRTRYDGITVTESNGEYTNSKGLKQTFHENYAVLYDELITDSIDGNLPSEGTNTDCTINVSVENCDISPNGLAFKELYSSYRIVFSADGKCSILLEPTQKSGSAIRSFTGHYKTEGKLIKMIFTEREDDRYGTTEGISTMMLYVEDGKIYDDVYRKKK